MALGSFGHFITSGFLHLEPWQMGDCSSGLRAEDIAAPWTALAAGFRHVANGNSLQFHFLVKRCQKKAQKPMGLSHVFPAECFSMLFICFFFLPFCSWHVRQRMLASRWPLLKLLSQLQSQTAEATGTCAGLWHPSLDWEEWRLQAKHVGFSRSQGMTKRS